MGTTYHVKLVFDVAKSPSELIVLQNKIQGALDRIDGLMSTYKKDSEISRFNDLAVGEGLSISSQTYDVLDFAQKTSQKTNGLFDVTVGPLVELWGFGAKASRLSPPTQSQIETAARNIGFDHFKLSAGGKLKKIKPSQIDLSSIAKGYAVDQASIALNNMDVKNYLIEVGGEIIAKGVNQQRDYWLLGIEQPDFQGQKAYTTLHLKDASLATSGDYRNFFEYDGKRYSHTINPKTFYPVQHQLTSISVIANSCMKADALATALMVMGEKQGYDFAIQNDIKAFFIYRSPEGFKSIATPGFTTLLN